MGMLGVCPDRVRGIGYGAGHDGLASEHVDDVLLEWMGEVTISLCDTIWHH